MDKLKSSCLIESIAAEKTCDAVNYGNLNNFIAIAEVNSCSQYQARKTEDAIDIIKENIDDFQLPNKIVACPSLQTSMPRSTGIEISYGGNSGSAKIGLNQAIAAIEDTGSLVLASSAASPTSINFLSDFHFVILERSRILKSKRDFWNWFRKEGLPMPRALNFISGPSRTADIEQTIQLGAHGPKQLTIIFID